MVTYPSNTQRVDERTAANEQSSLLIRRRHQSGSVPRTGWVGLPTLANQRVVIRIALRRITVEFRPLPYVMSVRSEIGLEMGVAMSRKAVPDFVIVVLCTLALAGGAQAGMTTVGSGEPAFTLTLPGSADTSISTGQTAA